MEKMKLLLKRIKQEQPARFFFLGGGQNELHVMDGLVELFPGSVNVVKEMDLETELALISRLDLMISMDSSNMHMASLLGVKTVTIWGGTHPYAGFSAYHEKNAVNIQIPKSELSCRPCTLYGKGKCHRGDFACMENLSADKVYEQLKEAGVLSWS
jgi:ADP-heptose:LPS heptosyltransferase